MNRVITNLFRFFVKEKPKFFGIPFNEQYECKDFYLKTIPLNNDIINNSVNNTNSIVIRKINDKIIPYKKQYECRDF